MGEETLSVVQVFKLLTSTQVQHSDLTPCLH